MKVLILIRPDSIKFIEALCGETVSLPEVPNSRYFVWNSDLDGENEIVSVDDAVKRFDVESKDWFLISHEKA